VNEKSLKSFLTVRVDPELVLFPGREPAFRVFKGLTKSLLKLRFHLLQWHRGVHLRPGKHTRSNYLSNRCDLICFRDSNGSVTTCWKVCREAH
jgi:hypothetical protein